MRYSEINRLQKEFPWPSVVPDVEVNWGPVWFSDNEQWGHIRIFKMLVRPTVQTIVELGSFLGRSSAGWLRAFPDAHVIAIDTWKGSSEHISDPYLNGLLPQLKATFQANLWEERRRLTAIQATTLAGLRRLHELRVSPDVIYVDADHSTEAVLADVNLCLDLFPDALIIGDDWMWASVRAAVEQISEQRGLQLATCQGIWWFPENQPRLIEAPRPLQQDRSLAKVITMTAYRRPDYTRKVLDALSRCQGIDEYQVLLHLEPGCPEVLDVIHNSRFAQLTLVENADRLGCGPNTFSALHHGFQLADFVIHLEDDTVPTPDCLRYFEWARRTYQEDRDVFSVTSYSKVQATPEQYHTAVRHRWYTPWGWGTWIDRWNEMAENWSNQPVTWDLALNHLRGERFEVHPLLARTQNIGAEMGEHCPSPEYHRNNHFNEFGAWSVELNPGAIFCEA